LPNAAERSLEPYGSRGRSISVRWGPTSRRGRRTAPARGSRTCTTRHHPMRRPRESGALAHEPSMSSSRWARPST